MNIESLINEWRKHVSEYAAAKAEHDYIKEYRKSLKSILMIRYAESGVKTGALQEAKAYADTEYIELLKGLRSATEKSEELRYRMMIAQARVDVWRSKNANNRKEQNNYGA